MAANLFRFEATALSIALTGVLFTHTVINDLRKYLLEIDKNGNVKKNHVQATKELCDFIQMDTLIKQLSKKFQFKQYSVFVHIYV